MNDFLKRLGRSRCGATAVEYGFILALICVAVIAIMSTVGSKTISIWTNVSVRFPTVQG